MQRPITGFHQDEDRHWVAELTCGHEQHTRHIPPLSDRQWVLAPDGRAERIGTCLDCVRCDRHELPEGFAAYRRTKSFDQDSIPAALSSNHTTKTGVWGLIHVVVGELDYTVTGREPETERLSPARQGVVVPEVEHRVTPAGDVEFYVEFWRSNGSGEGTQG